MALNGLRLRIVLVNLNKVRIFFEIRFRVVAWSGLNVAITVVYI